VISIRKADRNDISAIVDFQLRLADETEGVKLDSVLVTKGIEALFADPSKGSYSVATLNGEVVGCHLITYEWSEWRNGNVWWIQSVYVKQSHRKHGVFKAMYDNLIDQIKKDPAVLGLRLYVDKSNARAQQVYQSMGMNGEHYTVFEWMKG
jgi:ribosomal protein S18 acetylase RimI-like enzyme